MPTKAMPVQAITTEEFELCIVLNMPTNSAPVRADLLLSARRVMVEGMEPGVARADLPEVTKQSLSNLVTRLRGHYKSRLATMTQDQFDLCVNISCPEISVQARAFARNALVGGSNDLPASGADCADEAQAAIVKLRALHLSVIRAYAPL